MKSFWSNFTVGLNHFFTARHYAATWVLLGLILAAIVFSFIKYRAFWARFWRQIVLGLVVVLVIASFWVIPKINYWYDTRLVIPKYLSEQERKQDLDQWHQVLNNKEQGKNHSSLYNDIGILRIGVKDYKGAIRAFKLAISKNPDDARFYRNLAITYTSLEKYNDAEVAFKEAIRVAPTQPEYWLELGELNIYKIKDNEKARLFYLESMSRTGGNISVAQAFAQFLENVVKDYPEAIKYWQMVADGVDASRKLAFTTHIAELKLRAGIK